MAEPEILKLAELPGRGRALVASQNVLPGQILLQESPLLLYAEAEAAATKAFCAHCMRLLPEASCPCCPSCPDALFCKPSCLLAASSSSHTPWVCHALSNLARSAAARPDLKTLARFLIAAYNLAITSPSFFQQFLLLEGDSFHCHETELVYRVFMEALRSLLDKNPNFPFWSLEFVSALLAKDDKNAFGIMRPALQHGERSVRAYAIYAKTSFLNHDCLPNACRFDYVDRPGDGNTDITIRALHEIPEGKEACISYFPINWGFAERQKRLREDYGFECKCERCMVERNWNTEEEGDDIPVEEEEGDDEEMSSLNGDEMEEAPASEHDDFPHAMYFVKYLCPNENCGGTMAPLPPVINGISTTMECNVCGYLRTEEAFLEDLEEHRIKS